MAGSSTVPLLISLCPSGGNITELSSRILQSDSTPPGVSSLQPHKNFNDVVIKKATHRKQCQLALSLFVFRILTDHANTAFSFNDFAFFANRFHWWSNLHNKSLLSKRPLYIIAPYFGMCQAIIYLFFVFIYLSK